MPLLGIHSVLLDRSRAVRLPAGMSRPRSLTTRMLLLALFAVCSCGSDGGERHANPSPERSDAPADRGPTPPTSVAAHLCTPPAVATHATTHRANLAAATRALHRATSTATHTGHVFRTSLHLRFATGLVARATLNGRRTADGASTARLEWIGPASLVAPDADLRIEQDRLLVRLDAHHARWRDIGSASGIALDVGRELLTHPFLLQVTGVRGSSDSQTISLTAPAAGLRTYASTERRGWATDLLAGTRSLRYAAQLRSGRLAGDRFVLRTRLPQRSPLLPGSAVTVQGATAYCRLGTG